MRAALAAWNARDPRAFLSRLAEDVVLDELFQPGPFAGAGRVKDWIEAWTAAVPDSRTEIVRVLAAGDDVLVEAVVKGTLAGHLGPVEGTNGPFTLHRGLVVEVARGKLRRITAFTNGRELSPPASQP